MKEPPILKTKERTVDGKAFVFMDVSAEIWEIRHDAVGCRLSKRLHDSPVAYYYPMNEKEAFTLITRFPMSDVERCLRMVEKLWDNNHWMYVVTLLSCVEPFTEGKKVTIV